MVPSFPLRVAAIDAGSNAIRFLAAEFSGPDRWTILDAERAPVRLGRGVFRTGLLDEATIDAAAAALCGMRGRLEGLGVARYRAVATSAVRESWNGAAFVARVRREAGIDLEVISGTEEARLVHLAVASRIPLGEDRWLLVDLGGGSVEVSLVDRAGILWSESHTMGSVRLLEELEGGGEGEERFQRLLAEYAATLRIPDAERMAPAAGLIATGGNIEALAKLADADAGEDGNSVLPLERLRATIRTLSQLTPRERVERLGLREDRADVILPAARVYERVCALAGMDEVRVPSVGVKEGLLLDLVEDLVTHHVHEEHQDRQVFAGAVTLGRRYAFDEAHAVHVARLAAAIFDQLRPVHGLEGRDRRILVAAAVLHDIGQYISYKKHHKHSLYLISHSELPGFTPNAMPLIANVARYHRKAEPSADHPEFAELAEEDGDRVVRLSALLRLADALDREHLQRIEKVEAVVEEGVLVLECDGSGDLLLEEWALAKKAKLWEKRFGMSVCLRARRAHE